jgi:hypothetical protein
MLRKTFVFSIATLFVMGAAFAGAQTKDKKAKKPAKVTHVTTCPMSGKAVKDETSNCKMEGKYCVHFCCPNCEAPFEKLSKKDQEAKIKAAMKPAKPAKKAESGGTTLVVVNKCPMTGEEVKGEGGGKSVVGSYEVHFCCAGCKPEFDKLAKADQEAKIKSALK